MGAEGGAGGRRHAQLKMIRQRLLWPDAFLLKPWHLYIISVFKLGNTSMSGLASLQALCCSVLQMYQHPVLVPTACKCRFT